MTPEEFDRMFHPEVAEVIRAQLDVYNERVKGLEDHIDLLYELLDDAFNRIKEIEDSENQSNGWLSRWLKRFR